MRWYVAPAAAAALALALTGCSTGDGSTSADPSTDPATDPPSSTPASSGPASPGSSSPTGPPSAPAAEQPTDLLDWQPVRGPVTDAVTSNGRWTLTVDEDGRTAVLDGPAGGSSTTTASRRERVSDVLLDDDWAVVVVQDRQETRPARAVVTDLREGTDFEVGPGSAVPTTTGGTWALGAGTLVHATVSAGGRYCLATVDLATRTSERGWCAPRRHGFNGARVTTAGTTLMTFDDSRPSCRTVVRVAGTAVEAFEGTTPCKAWDGVQLGEDVQVWSEVPRENRVESARFFARSGGTVTELGPGSSGTLLACGGAAWFVRDPVRDGDPARLVRWSPADGASIAYETEVWPAFVAPPRCGGSSLTITSYGEGADEQVTAPVG